MSEAQERRAYIEQLRREFCQAKWNRRWAREQMESARRRLLEAKKTKRGTKVIEPLIVAYCESKAEYAKAEIAREKAASAWWARPQRDTW